MMEQQPIQTIMTDKSSYLSALGLFSLDTLYSGNTDTDSLTTDGNIFSDSWISRYSQALHRAEALYRSMRFAGQVSRFLSWLFHQPAHLIDASEITSNENTPPHFSGLKIISMSSIFASKQFVYDFDSAFYPLNDKHRTCWINLAALTLIGVELPAVDLLQVDKTYIVCDGHHHISVARALGQESVNAYVTKLPYPSRVTLGNRSK